MNMELQLCSQIYCEWVIKTGPFRNSKFVHLLVGTPEGSHMPLVQSVQHTKGIKMGSENNGTPTEDHLLGGSSLLGFHLHSQSINVIKCHHLLNARVSIAIANMSSFQLLIPRH